MTTTQSNTTMREIPIIDTSARDALVQKRAVIAELYQLTRAKNPTASANQIASAVAELTGSSKQLVIKSARENGVYDSRVVKGHETSNIPA